MTNEIECRFLEIDKEVLIKKLLLLGAKDDGETLLKETIFYDKDLSWRKEGRVLRIRKANGKTKVAYKEHRESAVDGAYEIEFGVDDAEKAEQLFEQIGLKAVRHQEKLRHTLHLDGVTFDIDTWPNIPPYVELEGESEEALKKSALSVGLNWQDVELHDAAWVIKNKYNIPVLSMKYFTFEKME